MQVVLIHEDLPLQADPAAAKTYLSILHDAVVYWNAKLEHDFLAVFPVACEAAVRGLMAEV